MWEYDAENPFLNPLNFTQSRGISPHFNRQNNKILAGYGLMTTSTIVQFRPNLQVGDRRSSKVCGVIERADHHCTDLRHIFKLIWAVETLLLRSSGRVYGRRLQHSIVVRHPSAQSQPMYLIGRLSFSVHVLHEHQFDKLLLPTSPWHSDQVRPVSARSTTRHCSFVSTTPTGNSRRLVTAQTGCYIISQIVF